MMYFFVDSRYAISLKLLYDTVVHEDGHHIVFGVDKLSLLSL